MLRYRFKDSGVRYSIHLSHDLARVVGDLVAPADEAVAGVGRCGEGYGSALVVGAHARYAAHGRVVHRGADEDLLGFGTGS